MTVTNIIVANSRLVHRRAASGTKRWTGTVSTQEDHLGYKTVDGNGRYTGGAPGVRNERTGTVGTQEGHLGYKMSGRGRLVHRRVTWGTK